MKRSIFAWVIISLICGCDPTNIDSNQYDDLDDGAEIGYEIEMNYTDGGQKLMTLSAPELKRYQGNPSKDVFPKGIIVDFYQEGEEKYAKLTADYAERVPDQYIVTATDNVVFQNTLGEKLETSELNWNERKSIIYTDRFAKLTRPNEIIYGYGFKANQDFTEISFEKTTGKTPIPQLEGVLK
ncbi:LPS export ABC transporter periplasmic protein LptC [Membranihabitans marinus]|uniref:LPS export ABC transporter periplasmic protein LptC n=1 Tax=Membranihabitans marinus TaxID=1227546 RepID=UPI001F00717E|nr:LPS export ABC transporter periplasmic protein LptC [Membranihabitans marinus]